MKKYDVIIIGAGPGGIFATYELSKKMPNLPQQFLKQVTNSPAENALSTETKYLTVFSVKAVQL